MLNSFEIKKYLKTLGFEHFKDNKRIDGFSHSSLNFPIYVKTTSNKRLKPTTDSPIVFHIHYEKAIKKFMNENATISAGTNFYFLNSNMTDFEKKLNGGKTETQIGIHLDIADKRALEALVLMLSDSKMENTSPELKVHQIDRIADVDEIVLQAIKTRRGQPSFRQALLAVFNGKCVISGCRVEAVLEAAHIIPHGEETNYRVANGLLLRADIHTLFDLGFIVVATSGVVKIDNSLKDSEYNQYDGVTIFEGEMPEELKTNLSKRQKYANEVA